MLEHNQIEIKQILNNLEDEIEEEVLDHGREENVQDMREDIQQ